METSQTFAQSKMKVDDFSKNTAASDTKLK
jgi:hypothetical protein